MLKIKLNQRTSLISLVLGLIILACELGQNKCLAQGEFHGASTPPVYTEGIIELHKYIQKNINYPESSKKQGISGIVTVSYVINKQGKIDNIKLLRGIDPECDSEAIRVTQSMTGWKPAMRCGKPVDCRMLMQVEFLSENNKQHKMPSVITGKVCDKITGKPIEGALVLITGTNIGTITDSDGNYRLDVSDKNTKLEISSMCYEMKIVELSCNQLINIELEPKTFSIDFNLNQIN